MRRAMRAIMALAAACALASCGPAGGRQAAPGAAPAGRMDPAGRYGLLTNGTTCPTTGCPHFVGAATATVDGRSGPTTFDITFDVTESGNADVGEVNFTVVGGNTYNSSVPPVVSFDGTDVVVSAQLSLPGQISGVIEATLRFDRTNPSTLAATFSGETTVFAVTAFQASDGHCGPCQAYTAYGTYGDPQRNYTFTAVDRGSIQAPDDEGTIIIDVNGDVYVGTGASVTNLNGLVTITANAFRASDNADVKVAIQYSLSSPTTASIYLDDLLIDPNASQTALSASSCDLFAIN